MDLAYLYARAVASSDLRVEADFKGDADLIIASGWAGSGNSLAALVHRARVDHDRGATSGSALRPAVAALQAFVAKQAVLMEVDLTDSALRRLTMGVMLILLRPVCPRCHGVGFKIIPGSTHLSDEVCPRCDGTGRRQVSTRSRAEAELVGTVRQWIEAKVRAHAAKMGRYLRR